MTQVDTNTVLSLHLINNKEWYLCQFVSPDENVHYWKVVRYWKRITNLKVRDNRCSGHRALQFSFFINGSSNSNNE